MNFQLDVLFGNRVADFECAVEDAYFEDCIADCTVDRRKHEGTLKFI